MKFIKWFFTCLIGIVLFVLILSLSVVKSSKNFIENELVITTVKEAIASTLSRTDLTEDQKELLEKLVKDKEAEKVVERIVQNFLAYQTEDDYKLEKSDYELLISFISNHLDEINKISNTNYTSTDVRNEIKYEDVEKNAIEAFKSFKDDMKDENAQDVIKAYVTITSKTTMMIFNIAILVCIVLISLINWSYIKWINVVGIDLIISGIFVGGFYALITYAKTLVQGEKELVEFIQNINFTSFLVVAALEFVVGILAVVLYNVLKKKVLESKIQSE